MAAQEVQRGRSTRAADVPRDLGEAISAADLAQIFVQDRVVARIEWTERVAEANRIVERARRDGERPLRHGELPDRLGFHGAHQDSA
ncbi:hypothetical protein WME91_33355 [Sorangium sp. So ce269]